MSYEYTILLGYFLFIVGFIYVVNNIQMVAEHPATEAIYNSFRYNLRDMPRVNYKEISSDEESESEFDTQELNQYESESISESEDTQEVQEPRRRRDPISISRIVGEVLD